MNKKIKNLIVVAIFLIVGFVLIPLCFYFVFHGNGQSTFLGLVSGISVESWFSFWITDISLIITAALTYSAYVLSKSIELNQHLHQTETDRMKFRISNVFDTAAPNGFHVELPLEVISLNDVKIIKATITFGKGECISFINSENE